MARSDPARPVHTTLMRFTAQAAPRQHHDPPAAADTMDRHFINGLAKVTPRAPDRASLLGTWSALPLTRFSHLRFETYENVR